MARNTAKKSGVLNTLENIKSGVKTIQEKTFQLTDTLVDTTLAAAPKWQKVMVKAIDKGTMLFEKQQDLVFTTLEGIKTQIVKGSERFEKLTGFELPEPKEVKKAVQDGVAKVTKTANKARKSAEKTVKENVAKVTKTAVKASKSAEKAVKEGTAKVTKAKAKVTKTTDKAVKAAAKKVEAPVKKVSKKVTVTKKATKPVASAKSDTKKQDLQSVDGIGPKIESILNVAGIQTLTQLAEAKVTDLQAILDTAGPRFKAQDPANWTTQAKSILEK